jgi:hypothetical protein
LVPKPFKVIEYTAYSIWCHDCRAYHQAPLPQPIVNGGLVRAAVDEFGRLPQGPHPRFVQWDSRLLPGRRGRPGVAGLCRQTPPQSAPGLRTALWLWRFTLFRGDNGKLFRGETGVCLGLECGDRVRLLRGDGGWTANEGRSGAD